MALTTEKAVKKQEPSDVAQAVKNPIVPPVDIFENVDSVTLMADMPGVGKEQLDLQIDKDTLTIHGKRVAAAGAAEGSYDEMPVRDYYRAFTIGEDIDRDKITASITNGVLKVVLHKSERAKPKKINISFS